MSYTEPNQMAYSRNTTHLNQTAQNIISNNSMIVSKAKVESKDHKWKEAPILGVEERQEM